MLAQRCRVVALAGGSWCVYCMRVNAADAPAAKIECISWHPWSRRDHIWYPGFVDPDITYRPAWRAWVMMSATQPGWRLDIRKSHLVDLEVRQTAVCTSARCGGHKMCFAS